MPVSPGFDKEPVVVETSVVSGSDDHFPAPCEDFTKDVEVGRIEPGIIEEHVLKKKNRHRPRKKKLYADICKQVEFYFSDANVSKNRNMAELISQSEYVGLHHLLGFNKIQKILPELNITYLQKALAHSEQLELSVDKTGVKRKVPYDPGRGKSAEELEKCTIYVENVPTHVDHEWLEKIFQEFGPIAYIAMPKFKHNGLPKGFAFVEFKDEEGAERCLNAYGDKGDCLPDSINPGSLLSVRTFEQPDSSTSPGPSSTSEIPEVSTENEVSGSRKRRRGGSADHKDVAVPTKKEKTETDDVSSSDQIQISNDQVDSSTENGNSVEKGVQNSAEKKKRRKNYKTKKLDNIEKRESDSIQLKILPKKIWRQLRNRYLNLQRENLGKLKRQLRTPNHPPAQKRKDDGVKETHSARQDKSEDSEMKPKARCVIVRLEFDKSFESDEDFKGKIMTEVMPQDSSSLVQFVDYSPPNTHAYVRLNGNPDYFACVGEFLRNATSHFKAAFILTEKEQQEYWSCVRQKIRGDAKKKMRGRDKLLQQAMKTATHIRFSDNDDNSDEVKAVVQDWNGSDENSSKVHSNGSS